jgi:hypothetical protein
VTCYTVPAGVGVGISLVWNLPEDPEGPEFRPDSHDVLPVLPVIGIDADDLLVLVDGIGVRLGRGGFRAVAESSLFGCLLDPLPNRIDFPQGDEDKPLPTSAGGFWILPDLPFCKNPIGVL